ncbi:C-type lectin domain family 4 member D-like isoform X1 [Lingula anatina]|uniref:C-type lectin domain family 4 member D-like isoform X1 n=1 Tax=Lingula anatina TaxID=7574 RepID=A0A1S3J1N1_LINAN|nr:C-type lectin domain family 4 member D-like isoform X1 [Lingula anatina]|eukprot:XP_013404168.1 C-type lectin domain family 4 member D-like isoform X1 [Lingula anatina]
MSVLPMCLLATFLSLLGTFVQSADGLRVLSLTNGTSDVQSKVDAIRVKTLELNELLSSVQKSLDSCLDATTTDIQCASGFEKFQRSCYKFVREEKTWQQAQNDCRTMGANLVSIKSWEEQKFILDHIAAHKDLFPSAHGFHAGATDAAMEGIWQWVSDGSLVQGYLGWDFFNPGHQNGGTGQNCLLLYAPRKYLWHDAPCSYKAHSICEIQN